MPDRTRLRGSGLLDGSLGGQCGVLGGLHAGACFETGPADCQTARSCITSADDLRRTQHLARWLARGTSAENSIRDGPSVLTDGSLAALWRMVQGGPGVLPDGSPAARRRMVWSRRPRCLAQRLARIGPVRWIVRRIRCLPNGSHNNCLTGKIRYGIRLYMHQRRWAWTQAQTYSSWSVLTISRLIPAQRISLNEVITGPSEVEG